MGRALSSKFVLHEGQELLIDLLIDLLLGLRLLDLGLLTDEVGHGLLPVSTPTPPLGSTRGIRGGWEVHVEVLHSRSRVRFEI